MAHRCGSAGFYQIAHVDTLRSTVETNPEQDIFYKPATTPAMLAAKRSRLGKVYLDWSSWPLVAEVGPAIPTDAPPGAPDWTEVSFRDLRFMYDTLLMQGRTNPPLTGNAYVDANGQVEWMEFGGHPQR